MKKRFLAVILTLAMLLSVLPVSALAAEGDEDSAPVCAGLEGCTEDAHDEECPLYTAPTEEDDTNSYYEFEDVYGVDDDTVVISLIQERINALPSVEELAEMGAEEQAEVYAEVCDISDAIDELTDEEAAELETTALEEAAAFFTRQIMPLNEDDGTTEEKGTQENPWNISAAGEGDNVTAYLTMNNDDTNNPTYTLVIEGTGDMKDFTDDDKAPWKSEVPDIAGRITAVSISDTVTAIGNKALNGLSELTTINGVDTTKTGTIVFPAQLTKWGTALQQTKLTGKLTFPTGCKLDDVGSLNIYGNNNITGVDWTNYPLTTTLGHWTEYGAAHTALLDLGLNTLPSNVTNIGDYGFKNACITTLTIPNTADVTYGTGAFCSNKNLKNLTINVEEENSSLSVLMFQSCSDLESVTFEGSGLTSIPGGVFNRCSKLSHISIPYGVTTICAKYNADSLSTFGIDTNDSTAEELDIIFPSTFTTITEGNHLFYYRALNKVKILAPNGFNWGEQKVGVSPNEKKISEYEYLYQYTLATEATCGDTVKVFSVTNQSDETAELPGDFGTVSYQIEDGNVLNEELKAVSAGTTKVEIFIAKSDTEPKTKIAETTITVSPKSVGVTMSNSTVDYDGNTKTIQATATGEGEALPADLTLVYSYKESSADDTTYTSIPPTAPGAYTVKVESGNPNYTLTGTTTATLTISTPSSKTDVSENDVVVAPTSLVYDGSAKSYAASYEGISEWSIVYYDSDGAKMDSAPVNAGDYTVTINGAGESSYASIMKEFSITPASLTITADNKSIYVGDALPEYTYTVSGLAEKDTESVITTKPTMTCSAADANTANTYTITASGADAGENYTITYVDGTLTVSRRSSGGGGGSSSSSNTTTETVTNKDGSTTTTVTDKKTGTVTETTKYKDGSTLVVETKKDGTVTTTETAANGVKVKTVDEPGEDVTAAVTIPRSVGTATVTIPADTTPGTVAVDAKTGEIVKLSVPTEDGMTVKLVGSANLVLEDRSKNFTDTRNHWAEDAIDFATAHEMFSGTSDTTFTPDSPMTRAMLMTVLARFDGHDTAGGSVWYEKGMAWAVANGVSDGSNPNGSITREQFATMLWRYAGSPAVSGSLTSFSDHAKVSGYATDAMRWAVSTGIIGGMGDGTLAPQGNATRAQVATMLMRFVENLTK
ncbi:MAG: hypothetical protein DBX60_07210 [Bacillota bacterium]|nr:MAG: hypothetical protein DBX60_07210 [Bacillota bacterium]